MKTLLLPFGLMMLLASCVFESPFEETAKVPTEQRLIGLWEEAPSSDKSVGDRMLVLQHSANEYLVLYPVGEKAMYFRTFAVDLAGHRCIQIQLIGTAEGPVKPENRKYHLLKMELNGETLELRTIDREVLGKDLKGTDALREAFATLANDTRLFAEPVKFRRWKDS